MKQAIAFLLSILICFFAYATDVETGPTIVIQKPQLGEMQKIAFSPNGKFIATIELYGAIKLLEINSGKMFWSLLIPNYQPADIEFSGDGKTIFIGGCKSNLYVCAQGGGSIKVLNAGYGEIIRTIKLDVEKVDSIELIANDTELAVAGCQVGGRYQSCKKGFMSVVDAVTGEMKNQAFTEELEVKWLAATGDGKKIFYAGSKGEKLFELADYSEKTLFIYDTQLGQIVKTIGLGEYWLKFFEYSEIDNKLIWVVTEIKGGSTRAATLVYGTEGDLRITTLYSGDVTDPAAPIKPFILSTSFTQSMNSPMVDYQPTDETGFNMKALALNADTGYLASINNNDTISIYNYRSFELVKKFRMPPPRRTISESTYKPWISSIDFSADGKLLAVESSHNKIEVFETPTGNHFKTIGEDAAPTGNPFKTIGNYSVPDAEIISIGPNGKFAEFEDGKSIKIYDIGANKTIMETGGAGFWAWSPDNNLALINEGTSVTDKLGISTKLKICDLRNNSNRNMTIAGAPSSAAISPDNRLLAIVKGGPRIAAVELWDIDGNKLLWTRRSPPAPAIAFSPDSKLIAAGGDSLREEPYTFPVRKGRAIVWRTATGKRIADIKLKADKALTVAFSHSGNMLAIAGQSNYYFSPVYIQVFDAIDNFKNIADLDYHKRNVFSVNFSPDDKFIISGGEEKAVVIGSIEDGSMIKSIEIGLNIDSVFYLSENIICAVSNENKSAKYFSVSDQKMLGALEFLDGGEWVFYTPDQYFDISENGKELIAWNKDGEIWPPEKYWNDRYRKGLWENAVAKGASVK